MKIRKATKKDIKDMQEMTLSLFKRFEELDKTDELDYSYWLSRRQYKNFEKLLKKKDYMFYIAEENKKIMGYVQGCIFKNYPIFKIKKKGLIDCLFVKPEYRKKGIAKKLTNSLLRWFKTKKIKDFTLGTQARDKEAIKFWKNCGFREYNVRFQK